MNELDDQYVPRFDKRGLHPLSLEVGRIVAFQELVPELAHAGFDALEFKREARAEATRLFMGERAT